MKKHHHKAKTETIIQSLFDEYVKRTMPHPNPLPKSIQDDVIKEMKHAFTSGMLACGCVLIPRLDSCQSAEEIKDTMKQLCDDILEFGGIPDSKDGGFGE
jgi:hypothetical protein